MLWTRQLGSDTTDSALALTGDGAGGVYVAGSTRGGLAAGPNSGGYDIWLARYSAAGGLTWINQRGTAENDT